jgi:hypothetical protein
MLELADRVLDTSSAVGTGTFTLNNVSVAGARTFADALAATHLTDGCSTVICIQGVDVSGNPSGQWEVCETVYDHATATVTRGTLFSSSTGARVDFAVGSKQVMLTMPASRTVQFELASDGVTPVGMAGPSYILGAYGIIPTTNNSAGISTAIAACAAAGGGIVQLLPVTYTCTEQIVLKSGVSIIGEMAVSTITSNVPEDSDTFSTGTILDGVNSSFIGIAGNAEDQASATTIIAASGSTGARTAINHFAENALQNIQLKNILLKNFTYGLKVGAVNNYGFLRSFLDNVYTQDCSIWGISLDNFQMCQFDNLSARIHASVTGSAGCIRLGAAAPSAVLIPGDSKIGNLYAITNTRLQRTILFTVDDANTNSLHNLNIYRIQSNRHNETSVYNAFTTVASTSIAVANCEYFPVDMPVWFTNDDGSSTDFTYGNGLNTAGAKQMYFIATRSAATGAGTVTICSRHLGTEVTMTAGGARRIFTGGYPGVEAVTKVGSGMLHCHMFGITAEGINNPAVSMQGLNGCSVYLGDVQSTAVRGIVLRYAASSRVYLTSVTNSVSTDFDSTAATTMVFGLRASVAHVGSSGCGIWGGKAHFGGDFTVANGVSGTTSTRTGNSPTGGGQVQVIASGVAAAGIVATITYPTLYEQYTGYYPTITPANAAASALTANNKVRPQSTGRTTGFDLVTDAILADGTYLFNVSY